MKFAAASFALVSSALAASSSAVSYEYETVTNFHTDDITITSCADNNCVTTVQSVTSTVVTATVDGVTTTYTTVLPESTTSASVTPLISSKPTSVAAESDVPSLSEDITYVDITTTPVVTASTGIESTVYQQSTFTSVYNSSASATASASVIWANDAPRNVLAGVAGVAGIAALLL
ncbi:hypothetical protein METBIDRAFT_30772 [Metschnikowia bicuspidata var. bicuspidata NRRL YB-4993]|uniref:Uncharacterized protein n=1 Tax=Metschnikowia bicuspidata var. bicuspidata NRRL YB-4993 TaxID=869754 RepID=A0A1A0HK23_9ASCO|nr:hypothetical protein METBIDRAFT_30772 [Metschnikowia bicuspidata var. bicuspidata NRRL YB-4993]OBA24529.1 hypothetical protein METBIDRAFT_30772 [Metschnikowia bicuspidata var. bicuspidata NRRL YB-4993]